MKTYYVIMQRRGSRPREWAGFMACLPEASSIHEAVQEVEHAYELGGDWSPSRVQEVGGDMRGAWQVDGTVLVRERED